VGKLIKHQPKLRLAKIVRQGFCLVEREEMNWRDEEDMMKMVDGWVVVRKELMPRMKEMTRIQSQKDGYALKSADIYRRPLGIQPVQVVVVYK
jgi:hypothetical protein